MVDAEYHRNYYHQVRRPKVVAYLGDRCEECGSTDDLQFDHVEREQKSFNINENLTLNDTVRKELDKCQLLCRPCHEAKTGRENTRCNHGSMHEWMHKKCGCDVCLSARREWYDKRNAARRKPGGRGPYRKRASLN
ncbi:hypothetical protein MINTM005_13890 [Mycobacterium intracellulare]|nr:hypothetical protein MINTM005_13890 [Mycobacterium intracellulare]